MYLEDIFKHFTIYVEKRHKKQSFYTIMNAFDNQVKPYLTGKDITKLTKLDIINWQDSVLEKNFSNKYNSKIYYVFKIFLDYCVSCSYLESNLLSEIGTFPRKIEIKKYVVYTLFQFRRFRFRLCNFVIKQYFNFMYFNGTRPSEAMALQFKNIKRFYVGIFNNIHRKGDRELDTPKNESSIRVIRISLLQWFRIQLLKVYYYKKYGSFSNEYYVFGGEKPLSPTTIDRYKKIAYEKAKLPSITQHEFRHSYATRMIHKKVPIDIVSRNLGHSQPSTTLNIYLHQEKNTISVF